MDSLEAQRIVEISALFPSFHYSREAKPQVSGSQSYQSPTLHLSPEMGCVFWTMSRDNDQCELENSEFLSHIRLSDLH